MLKVFPENQLFGDRVVIKRHSLEVAEVLFGVIDSERKRLRRFLSWVDHVQTLQDEIDVILSQPAKWENAESFNYLIFDRLTDEFIGAVGVHGISFEHERCEIGYWVLEKFEGKGFVSEAVLLLDQELFRIGFHRVEIHCSTANLKSSRVPIRCGYVQEATLRDSLMDRGKFRGTLIFGKLKTDVRST